MSFDKRKIRVGRVVSDKMEQSVVVLVEWRSPHALYGKPVRRSSRFKVHDEGNSCKIGDVVKVIETRPISRTKRWRILEVLSRKEMAELQPEEIGVGFDPN